MVVIWHAGIVEKICTPIVAGGGAMCGDNKWGYSWVGV